ncbi:hypothetical protein THAOC_09160 [Thalassiosira oceanica]|uniref:Uncharacterized protein n=1 Tax=Thalassiosira oceanica TaxID=159749 RepID=K0T890_THAOC|nr:hypothetical protein THAOC_09160 [Thalassiosira oceanica]|eukprot:EJK69566.1 hypothetical protein THAOC_09160 [Thalassiosira oceanica]
MSEDRKTLAQATHCQNLRRMRSFISFILYLLFFDCSSLCSRRGYIRSDHTNLGFSSLRQERQTRSLRSEAARGSAGSGAPLTGAHPPVVEGRPFQVLQSSPLPGSRIEDPQAMPRNRFIIGSVLPRLPSDSLHPSIAQSHLSPSSPSLVLTVNEVFVLSLVARSDTTGASHLWTRRDMIHSV